MSEADLLSCTGTWIGTRFGGIRFVSEANAKALAWEGGARDGDEALVVDVAVGALNTEDVLVMQMLVMMLLKCECRARGGA
jgi:hypothetical protein